MNPEKTKMSKKKRGSGRSKAIHGSGVMPEFKRHIEETHGEAVDFSGASDEMRLSHRIMQLIDPYMEAFDVIILVDCVTIAWNECLREDFNIEGPFSLNNALLNYANYKDLIDILKSRKREMFSTNRRHIREVKVYEKGDNISVNVASDFDMKTAFTELAARLEDVSQDEP